MFIFMGLRIQNQIKNTDGHNRYWTHSTGPFLREYESLNDCINSYKRETLRAGKSQIHSKFMRSGMTFTHLPSSLILTRRKEKKLILLCYASFFRETQCTVFCSCKATARRGYICTNVLLCSQHCTRSYIIRTQTQYLFNHCNTLYSYSVIFQYTRTGV